MSSRSVLLTVRRALRPNSAAAATTSVAVACIRRSHLLGRISTSPSSSSFHAIYRRPSAITTSLRAMSSAGAAATPTAAAAGDATLGPVAVEITRKLTDALEPVHLDVINESYMHNVPRGSETHFKVVIVSAAFVDTPVIKRHRMVNALLDTELKTGVHALSIKAKTPEQWAKSQTVDASPSCLGGSKK